MSDYKKKSHPALLFPGSERASEQNLKQVYSVGGKKKRRYIREHYRSARNPCSLRYIKRESIGCQRNQGGGTTLIDGTLRIYNKFIHNCIGGSGSAQLA